MADPTDRVAAVVARAIDEIVPRTRSTFAWGLVDALDAAGLLLTEQRRARIMHVLNAARELDDRTWEERCALLRELAGDGGAPKDDPLEAVGVLGSYGPSPVVLTPPEPTPAPRRMAANPASAQSSGGMSHHATEHDETLLCAVDPPCQPVAAAGTPDLGGATMLRWNEATPAHEHRWAAVAYALHGFVNKGGVGETRVENIGLRVTREHCVVGDCQATREV